MVVVFAIGAGLILGSFLSVLVERWPQWRGVLSGRSQCPHCRHTLAWVDLVPLASWLLLRGRCRYCHARISPNYPAYELVTAAVFGSYVWQQGLDVPALVMLFGFIALFFFDLRHMVLPDAMLLPMGIIALISKWHLWPLQVPIAVILVACFGALYVLGRGHWLGLGDVKMAGVVGLWFGSLALPVTLVAVWAGGLTGVGLLALGKANRTTPLPFGAFWSATAVAAMVWPEPFVRFWDLLNV